MASDVPPEVVTLYTRPGCHLCDVALQVLRAVQSREPFELEIVDISSDPVLRARYRMDIPVVVIRKVPLFRHRVDGERLTRLLRGEEGIDTSGP